MLSEKNRKKASRDEEDEKELAEMVDIFQMQGEEILQLKSVLVRYVMKVCNGHDVILLSFYVCHDVMTIMNVIYMYMTWYVKLYTYIYHIWMFLYTRALFKNNKHH